MAQKRRPYVAYNRRSGIPWAASFDRDKIFDYAEDNHLVVIDVDWLEEGRTPCPELLSYEGYVHECVLPLPHAWPRHMTSDGRTWSTT